MPQQHPPAVQVGPLVRDTHLDRIDVASQTHPPRTTEAGPTPLDVEIISSGGWREVWAL